MKLAICSLLLIGFCQEAFAEVTVIYRKSDNAIVGKFYPPQTAEAEINNILNSELGGTTKDYAMATLESVPIGHEIFVNAGRAETREKSVPDNSPVDIPIKDLGSNAIVSALTALGVTSLKGIKKKEGG